MKNKLSKVSERIDALISHYAQDHAEQVALVANDKKLTYGVLDHLSDRLCQRIIQQQVDAERPIAVCLPPSLELFVSLLAVLKSNHIFMYLPPGNSALQQHYSTYAEPELVIGENQFLTGKCVELPIISCDLAELGEVYPERHSALINSHHQSPAAILFTSGTTGASKGVLYDHHGLLNLIQIAADQKELTVLQLASPLFDAFWVESLSALLNGGQLILPDRDNLQPQYIFELIKQYRVNFMVVVTSFLRTFSPKTDWVNPELTVYCVGESCSPELAKQWSQRCRFYHAYGVTEAGIHSHHYLVSTINTECSSVPVGRPIKNIFCYLLNEDMQHCGMDEIGEVYLGGDCIALGYYRSPELTAEHFVTDLFSSTPDKKMFRTGDLGRYDQDGNLIIVGRRDEQIKIRGIRVNCELLEQQLMNMPGVENAAIVSLNHKTDIAAFVSVESDFIFADAEQEYMNHWQKLVDELDYHQGYEDEFNIAGWHCSYRNQPLPDFEMREQVHQAAKRILELKPRYVLDIGCGTGLLLFQIAPFCEGYWASDLSGQAIDQICKRLSVPPWIENVTTLHQPAHDFSIFESQEFDTIILNSTVQYFPNLDYLTRIIEKLCSYIKQGNIFIGDVKHHQLQSAFQFERMRRCNSYQHMTVAQMIEEVENSQRQNSELSITPEYFYWLGQRIDSVNYVQIMPKAGHHDNELNQFRYDVVLHIQAPIKKSGPIQYLQWGKDVDSLECLKSSLVHYPGQNICLMNVPDNRKSQTLALWSYLRDYSGDKTERLIDVIASFDEQYIDNSLSVEPEDLIQLGETLNYVTELSCLGCADEHQFDIVFWQSSDEKYQLDFLADHLPARRHSLINGGLSDLSFHAFANRPYVAIRDSLLINQAETRIAELFQGQWMPLQWVKVLEQLPLGHTGKTDRKALEQKAQTMVESHIGYRSKSSGHHAALHDTELSGELFDIRSLAAVRNDATDAIRQVVGRVWCDVLGDEALNSEESFFALGGHSLKAVQIISRLNQIYQSHLKVVDLLQNPKLEALVNIVRNRQQRHENLLAAETSGHLTPENNQQLSTYIDKAFTTDELLEDAKPMVSYTQRRYWFLEQLNPESSVYNLPLQVSIRGTLDKGCLEYALRAIGQRHQVFKTRIVADDENDLIQLTDAPAFGESLEYLNIRHLDRQRQTEIIDHYVEYFIRQPFDLSVGPLHRSMLIQIAENQHLLLITLHHIIADGWSLNILLQEFRSFYQARMNGDTNLSVLPKNQYISYSTWQNLWLGSDEAKQQKQYWLRKLNEICPFELPTDFSRIIPNRHRGKTLFTLLDSQNLAALKTLAAGKNCTLFMVLLTIFKILLWRHSDRDDLSVGTPVANRHRLSDEQVIGSFANTLVICSQLDERLTFEQLLEQVRTNLLEAYLHQDYPFEKLVEDIQPERDLGRSPIIQIWFSYFNTELDHVVIGDMELEELETGISGAKFDLSLSLTESGNTLKCAWEYNTDLYCHETISRLSERWGRLVSEILSSPLALIGDYTMLPEQSMRRSDGLLMQETVHRLSDDHVMQCFDKWVQTSSSNLCLIDETARFTYGEVARQVHHMAAGLISHGIRSGMRVAVFLPEKLETSLAILAIFRVGACVVPISWDYPRERICYILEDAGIDLLVHHETAEKEIIENVPSHISFSALQADLPYAAEPPYNMPSGEETAYILYTSGTEGWPKGVEVAHQSVSILLLALAETLEFTEQCKMLSCSSVGFDIFMLELLMPLFSGGAVYLAASLQVKDPENLIKIIDTEHPSHIQATPSLYHMLVNQSWVPANRLTLLCGGEALTEKLAASLLQTGVRLYNMYGPTETTIWSTFAEISDPQDISIGKPVPGTNCYILDRQQRPLCNGIVGELYIGGMGVARGYIRQSGQNSGKFIPDPFSHIVNARMYRTGDLARVGANGKLYLLGRKDTQIKLSGHRIELSDIEKNLERCQSVDQACVVFLSQDKPRPTNRIVAFVTGKPNTHVDITQLRKELICYLPAYMLPNPILQLETLPHNVHGKIDRNALLSDYLTLSQIPSGRSNVSGKTPLESFISTIWAETLGNIEAYDIRPEDNFFSDLGGNSLMIPQMMSIIRFGFHMGLPLRTIFESPVLKDFCASIETLRESEAIRPPSSDIYDNRVELSGRQQYLMRQIVSSSVPTSYYNRAVSYSFTVDSEIGYDVPSQETLSQRVKSVLRQSEVFRYRLLNKGEGTFEWSVFDHIEPEVTCHQILSHQLAHDSLTKILQHHREREFDLYHQALIRVLLLQIINDVNVVERYVIQVVGHGLVGDNRTFELVLQQISDNYRKRPEPTQLQYRHFVQWMDKWLSGPVAQQQKRLLTRWFDRSDVSIVNSPGAWVPEYIFHNQPDSYCHVFALSPERQQKIEQLASSVGCPKEIIYLSAYFRLLQKHADAVSEIYDRGGKPVDSISSNHRITVGWLNDHRDWSGTDIMFGPMENLLLVQAEFAPHVTDKRLVSLTLEAYHRAYFLRDVVSHHMFTPSSDAVPIHYDASFSSDVIVPNMLGMTANELEAGIHLQLRRLSEEAEQLELRVNQQMFSSGRFSQPVFDSLVNDFESILENLAFDIY